MRCCGCLALKLLWGNKKFRKRSESWRQLCSPRWHPCYSGKKGERLVWLLQAVWGPPPGGRGSQPSQQEVEWYRKWRKAGNHSHKVHKSSFFKFKPRGSHSASAGTKISREHGCGRAIFSFGNQLKWFQTQHNLPQKADKCPYVQCNTNLKDMKVKNSNQNAGTVTT